MSEAFTIEEYSSREDWLKARTSFIGASETAGILGASKWSSPLAVYAAKLGVEEERATTGAMELGNILEPYVADRYAKATGDKLTDPGRYTVLRSRKYPFIAATLDRVIERGAKREPLELKAPLHLDDWASEPPGMYQVQLMQQLFVTGWERGVLAGLSRSTGAFIHYPIERHEAFLESMVEQLTEFWARVQSGDAPPADASPATATALALLYPENKGGEVALGEEFLAWDRQRTEAAEAIKAAEERKREAENHIRKAIGDASSGRLPTGERYSWNLQERAEHVVKASSSRVLRRHAAPKGRS